MDADFKAFLADVLATIPDVPADEVGFSALLRPQRCVC